MQIDYGECKVCQGQGAVVIEAQLIEMDDLDAMASDPPFNIDGKSSGAGRPSQ